jgi:surface protein
MQLFNGASAFNQNIAGWNTARVSNMNSVCHHHAGVLFGV